MAGQIIVVVNQIIIFAILMFIGFIAAKTKIFTKDALSTLSRLIVKIILPALIFSIVAGSGVTLKEFLISGRFAIGVVSGYTILILAGILMSRLCKLQGITANIFIALASFGNMGFMGIPLIQAIFKEPVAQVTGDRIFAFRPFPSQYTKNDFNNTCRTTVYDNNRYGSSIL